MVAHFTKPMEDVELFILCLFKMLNVNEKSSTSSLGIDAQMFGLPSLKVNLFHVIFYLNGVLLATHFKLVQSIWPLI
jgi:hypothetical protein